MNIFSKTNRSIADAAAKIMSETKPPEVKPLQPLDQSVVNKVVENTNKKRFDLGKK
jgi:hypothetical protein